MQKRANIPNKTNKVNFGSVAAFLLLLVLLISIFLIFYFYTDLQKTWNDYKEMKKKLYVEGKIEEVLAKTNYTRSYTVKITDLEQQIFDSVNEERLIRDLKALEWNSDLAFVARLHSADMASNNYFNHSDPEGNFHDDRLAEAGIYYYNYSAENLALGSIIAYKFYDNSGEKVSEIYKTQKQLIEVITKGWMNSTGHRKNILNPKFNEAGVGISSGQNKTYYITQLFETKTECGFRYGNCCREGKYYYCYSPWECNVKIELCT